MLSFFPLVFGGLAAVNKNCLLLGQLVLFGFKISPSFEVSLYFSDLFDSYKHVVFEHKTKGSRLKLESQAF